jgi:hypothetical protein
MKAQFLVFKALLLLWVRQLLPAMQIMSGWTVADLSNTRENPGHYDGKL